MQAVRCAVSPSHGVCLLVSDRVRWTLTRLFVELIAALFRREILFSDSSNGAGLNWFLARSRIYKSFLNMFALNSFTTVCVFFFYLIFCVLLARVKHLHGNSLRGKNIASCIFRFFQESDFKIHFTQTLFCLNLPWNVLLFLPFPRGE